jgi:hypothetical protein
MKSQLISLVIVLAVLGGCPETPSETAVNLAKTAAASHYDVGKEKCGALTGVTKHACISTADATLAASHSAAIAIHDVALVTAEHHE